jgi:hypothetical protein
MKRIESKWSEDAIGSLIEKLEADYRDMWGAYVKDEMEGAGLGPEVSEWILNALHQLHPSCTLNELTDILLRVRSVVRKKLGLEFGSDPFSGAS